MDFNFATQVMNMMIALILSLTLHEAAHAFVAYLQGDNTAKSQGRLSLNPIVHMDPVGTILFPLIGSMLGGFIFGWAKPVPVNTRNLKNQKWGYVLVAFAGPASNLILCFLSVIAYRLIGPVADGTVMVGFSRLAEAMVQINAILAVFNLLPLYPLDGGAIIYEFLPRNLQRAYEEYIIPYGNIILLALIFTGGFRYLAVAAQVWIIICDNLAQSILI